MPLLWPLYTLALGRLPNVIRVPLGLSLLLGLVFIGTISGKGGNAYRNASGQTYDGYVARWLIVCAALFVISAVVYFVRAQDLGGAVGGQLDRSVSDGHLEAVAPQDDPARPVRDVDAALEVQLRLEARRPAARPGPGR